MADEQIDKYKIPVIADVEQVIDWNKNIEQLVCESATLGYKPNHKGK